jgi:hypothetical protein
MGEYRAYILDADGRIASAVNFESDDDESARVKAKQLVDGHDVELWQLGRRIETFKHRPK